MEDSKNGKLLKTVVSIPCGIVCRERQRLTRAKSPTELAEMSGLSDFPIPTFVQDLGKKLPTAGGGDG